MLIRFLSLCVVLFSLCSSANCGLIAHYEFEGNGLDSSGNAFHGTINGSTATVASAHGSLGNALQFNSSWMALPNNSSLAFGSPSISDFSAAFWFNADEQMPGDQTFGLITNQRMTPALDHWGVHIQSGSGSNPGRLDVSSVESGVGSSLILSPNRVDNSLWHHVSYVRDSTLGTISTYLNGALIGGAADPTSVLDSGQGLAVGNYRGQLATFRIDDLRLYDHALSAAEVSALSSAAVPEPSSWALQSAVTGLGLWRHYRRKRV